MNGFCPQCSAAYDFRPSLKTGDLVAGKYEIKGPIGLGGMGWIYLGFDVVLKRWVVLKGVLNEKDPEAAAAAIAERQFLAAVKHPNIVSIYDFVSQGSQGYMVLEYVGGRTLDAIRGDFDLVDLISPDDGRVIRNGRAAQGHQARRTQPRRQRDQIRRAAARAGARLSDGALPRLRLPARLRLHP